MENRTWRTNYRGRIYVHASQTISSLETFMEAYEIMRRQIGALQTKANWVMIRKTCQSTTTGSLIGEVDLVDCVTQSNSPWFEPMVGQMPNYGFVLANPLAYEKPISFKGRLGFFEVADAAALQER